MADTGSIEGKVFNQRNNQPLAGASAQLSGEGVTQNTSTGQDGGFQFANLAPGNYDLLVYDLLVQKEGFYDGIYGPLVVFAGNATEITVALQPRNI